MASLVTGASGFLGGRLAQLLVEQGEDVVVLARSTSDLRHLTDAAGHLIVRVVHGDLGDTQSLHRAVAGVEHIFHCAACSTDWAPWKTYFEAYVTGTRNLLAAAVESATLKRFVHVSTTDVYGYPSIPCSEDHALVDAGLPYNQTKRLGEMAVWEALEMHNLPVTIVRPATIFGPRGKDFTLEVGKMLRQRMMLTIDGGNIPGGFAYVDNVAAAMIAAATSPKTLGQAYNLADGSLMTWATYLALFAKALASPRPWLNLSFRSSMRLATLLELPHRLLRLGGRPLLTRHAVILLGVNQEFPVHKAIHDFGFNPVVSIEEGIIRSAEWLLQRQETAKPSQPGVPKDSAVRYT